MVGVVNPIGPRTGAALRDILAGAFTSAHGATVDATHTARVRATSDFMEHLESEIAPLARRVFAVVLDDPDSPEHLRAIAEVASNPTHQADLMTQLFALLGVVFGGFTQLSAPLLAGNVHRLYHDHQDTPLSPAEAAQAVIREATTYGYAANEAAYAGVNDERFALLTALAGNPPGIQEMLFAYRRGIIDQARLHHGIAQSDLRTEWVDVIEALRFVPMSPAEAIQAAVEGHLSVEEAKAIAAQGGLLPEHFEPLYQAAGNPPGPGDIGELLNRGSWTLDQAKAAMRESRTKPKYEDDVLSLREQLPPREAIVLMVERGVVTVDKAVSMAMQLGYNRENATFLVQEAVNRKMGHEKDLAKAEITQLYAAGIITSAEAAGFLRQLNYDDHEAGLILDLVDTAMERQAVTQAIGKVRSLFVSHHIDRTEVSGALDTLGVKNPKRDDLLRVWELERDANTKDLTLAELRTFVRAGLLPVAEYRRRLVAIGYSPDDADLFAQLEAGRG